MKWILGFIFTTSTLAQKLSKKYELQSPKGFHMKSLSLNESLFTRQLQAYSLKDEHVLLAKKHVTVQLKQAFWLVHGNKRPLSQQDYEKKWEKFQADVIDYGCHCFVRKFEVGGAGRVVDKMDLACRDLHRCQLCLNIDSVEGDFFTDRQPECHKHVPYFSKLTRSMNGTAGLACGRGADVGGAQTICQLANCNCDLQFARNLVDWYVSHYKEENKQIFTDGTTGICVNDGENIGPPEGCCGAYPDRRAYWGTLQKGCCGDDPDRQVTYDQTTEQCCNE